MARYGYTDSQRKKLYAAENAAFAGSAFEDKMNGDEAFELVLKIWDSASGLLGGPPTLRLSRQVRGAWYFQGRHEILFHPDHIRPWIVVHEVAHAVEREGAGHGPEFARTYLGLVERTFGFEAREKLGASFRKHKVRTTGKSTPRKKAAPGAKKRETKRGKADRLAGAVGWVVHEDDWNRHWYCIRNAEGTTVEDGFWGLDAVIRHIEKQTIGN
jgi:hypothetical protein